MGKIWWRNPMVFLSSVQGVYFHAMISMKFAKVLRIPIISMRIEIGP
jgi:hypothetical protein